MKQLQKRDCSPVTTFISRTEEHFRDPCNHKRWKVESNGPKRGQPQFYVGKR